jgi:hypothetical protein
MDAVKSISNPNTGRRSFLWKAGTALSAALAYAVPSLAAPKAIQRDGSNAEVNRLSRQLGMLEDEKSIRALHQSYENRMNNGRYEEAVDLFAENSIVVFNGGVFEGKTSGIARLYCERFRSGLTGKNIGPAPGAQAAADPQRETITISADRLSAKAQFPYSIQVGVPLAIDSSLVQMARLQGEGIMKWCESGTYAVSYVKDMNDGSWKIQSLEYRVVSQNDFRPGKAYAKPIFVPMFAKTYPEDSSGPDRLLTRA